MSLPRSTASRSGAGRELALVCDFRMCTERARFGQPEILLGIIPGGGGTQRLARLIGTSRAKDLILTGRQVDPTEALAIGLVDSVVPVEELEERALARARAFAAGPVVAHGLAKRAIDEGLDMPLGDAVEMEHRLFVQSFGTDDELIGVVVP